MIARRFGDRSASNRRPGLERCAISVLIGTVAAARNHTGSGIGRLGPTAQAGRCSIVVWIRTFAL